MIQVTSSNRSIKIDDLAQVERVMGRPLPEDYRSFLVRTNGGRPEADTIDIEGAHFRGTDIQVFHGIDTEIESSDILWYIDILEGCKENHLLPVAHDSGGNIFMLVLAEEDYGHVLYFDSDEIPPRPYHIANDFNEFLGLLRDWTPEERADIDAAARGPDEP